MCRRILRFGNQRTPDYTLRQSGTLSILVVRPQLWQGPMSIGNRSKPVRSAKATLTHFGSVLRGTDAPRAPAAVRGRTFTIFVPQRTFSQKKFDFSTNRGQQGDKREKVKKLKCLFAISYRLFLFPASESKQLDYVYLN